MSPQLMTPRDGFPPHDTTNTQIPTMKPPGQDVSKWIGLLLTLIGMLVAMVVWATNQHAELREWAIDQDYNIRIESRDNVKEKYVPLHEFTRLKQKLEDQSQKIDDMSLKLDKMLEEMHKITTRRGR